MSAPLIPGSIRNVLDRQHRALRRAIVLRCALRGAALAAIPLVLLVLAGAAFAAGVGASWVRLGLAIAAVVACVVWAVARFLAQAPRFDAYLETVEGRFPDVRSWLRNAIDFAPRVPANTPRAAGTPDPGTSADLARAVLDETARRLEGVPLGTLSPGLQPRRPALAIAASGGVLVLAALLFPARIERSWRTLWNPALAAPPVSLSVEPGSVKVTPGASLAVFARVAGTERAPRLTRTRGAAVAGVLDGRTGDERLWRFDLAQLTREEDYQVRVASTESPRYHISLAGEPVPVSFEIEYRAPAYARLPVQRGSSLRGDLAALRGTRAHVVATFDRDLARLVASVPGAGPVEWRSLSARRWAGDITLDRDAEYELHAVAGEGEGRFRYRLSALADAPPVLAVRVPTGDMDLPAGQQVPVEVVGQDDLGLTELVLQYRKDPAAPWTNVPLARFDRQPREAEVRARWDAASVALLPGERAAFRFVLYDDNALSRGRAESATFELRFPSLADLYETIDDQQGRVQKTLEKVADKAQELQRTLDKMSRQQQQQARTPQTQQPGFERSEELKNTLQRQQDLARQLDDASRQLKETLTQAQERNAFDEQLANKMKEMAELLEQIQSPEFRDALKKMHDALENLDRRALENQLPQWRAENKEMLQNLERTIELLKQLRQEEQLQSMARRAEELKAQQDQLNREHEQPPQDGSESKSRDEGLENENQRSPKDQAQQLSKKQEQAAQESEKLAKDVEDLAKEIEASSEEQREMNETADALEQEAAQEQHEAAESAEQQQSSQASKSGQKASQSLQRAARRLQKLSSQRQQQREGVDVAAVRRAAQDLVSLQRESEQNLDGNQPMNERADRQTDLSEGVSRIADSLFTLSQRTPFISPKLSEALGRAQQNLSQSGKDLASGNRARGEQMGRQGGSSLNEAVLELREAESSMCKMPGQGNGQQQGAKGQMSKLGEQQQQLNQRSQSLAQRLSQQMRLSAGDRGEMERMAQEQARLREQLSQIERDDAAKRELLGRLDAAQREMREVEEALREGHTGGDLEEKQNRILSRLLDASRSVNRRDFEPQREARPGVEISERSAPEIPGELLRETDRLRQDLLKAEADRYPAQYRALIEAYLRTLNGSRR